MTDSPGKSNEDCHESQEVASDKNRENAIKVEVLKSLAEHVCSYRTHLEQQLSHFKWLVIAIAAVAGGVFVFLIGDTYKSAQDKIQLAIETKITDEEFFKQYGSRLQKRSDEEVDAVGEKLRKQIDVLMRGQIQELIDSKVTELDKAPPSEIIERVFVPTGTVLAYAGRLSCADNLAVEEAYERQMPLWPEGGQNWLVCNGCTLKPGTYSESLMDANVRVQGLQIPDLREQFIRGAPLLEDRGNSQGQEQHTHSIRLTAESTQPLGREPFAHVPDKPNEEKVAGYTHQHDVTLDGTTSLTSNIPPCTSTVFIIRVK